jgi:hypothetical protein
VITCSRCGNIVATGQSNCQYCGMPVINRSEYGANGGKMSHDQPELPAWLQSLRAGTQPTYTTGGNNNFSASDLIEEGALPGWMKPGQSGQSDSASGLTGPHAALRPSSMPAPDTDGSVFPGGSMSASSLIDEQALPPWMREQSGDRQGLSAASLVQPDALPSWLREQQAGPDAQRPQQPQVSGQPRVPQAPQLSQPPQAPRTPQSPQTPPAVMSVPPALTNAPQGQMPPVMPSAQPFQGQPLQTPAPQSVFPARGLSARDLIDAQSLPSWMSGQPGLSTNGEGMSAASLLDMNALPSWLRENGQNGQGMQGPQGPQSTNPSSMNMNGVPAPSAGLSQTGQSQQPPAQHAPGGSLVAASFIDMDALPDWLRAADAQADQSRSSNGGIPPRVENVRVPGRPRGGVNPQEASAAAANVFASMLGVASNAPQLPAQPQMPQQGSQGNGIVPGQTQGQPRVQSVMPGGPDIQAQGYPGPGQGYGPQGYQTGPQGPQGLQGPQGYQAGYPGYPMGSQLGVSQPPLNQGMAVPPGQPVQGGQQGQQGQPAQVEQPKKATRRGFLDTIREWFRF